MFNGRIIVSKNAQKTQSSQSNKNLLLSDYAEIDTTPELQIYADDVKCSHGATVGKLDLEQLFYLQARGIDEKTARFLLIDAFAFELLEKIKDNPMKAFFAKKITEKLHSNQLGDN